MSHSCANKHTDNVTTSARSVHPLLVHKHEDADAIHQLRCHDALVHDMPNMKTLLQFVDTVHP